MSYRIRQCTWQSGERYCMLVDADTGMPPWYPMLFITTRLRNRGRSVATMEAALGAIQVLLEFAEAKGMDLEARVLKREFLGRHEIDALCDEAQRRRRSRRGDTRSVSIGHHYKRLTYIAKYLEWFVHEVLDGRRSAEDDSAIAQMVLKLHSRRPDWSRNSTSIDRGLTDEQLKRMLEIINPTHPDNPFADEKAAVRNHLAVLILARLGVRRGELLGIQVGDIDWSTRKLAIERRPDEKHDPRSRQPRAKTLARKLALNPEVLELLLHYVKGARARTPGTGTHRYLLVVHKKGPDLGQPLSESGLDAMFAKLRGADPLLAKAHAHAFRHTWNWQFSIEMDAKPKDARVSPDEQAKIREHWMGWNEGSDSAKLYNRRFIQQKAQEVSLELAEEATTNARKRKRTPD